MRIFAQRECHEAGVIFCHHPMSEQTLSFVLKLRLLYPNPEADGKPLLRGSLTQIGDAQMRHFDALERLVEILNSSMNHMAVKNNMEEARCESQDDT